MCSSRKHPYPPHGELLKIPRVEGSLKAKILKGKYQSKLEFPAVLGGLKQNPLWKVCGHHPKQHNKKIVTPRFSTAKLFLNLFQIGIVLEE